MPKVNRKLTDIEIKNAKPEAKAYKLYDDGGLRVLVRPSGTKVWQYPYTLDGKANVFTIGRYGEISTADARKKRDEVKALLREGIDPNGHQQVQRAKAKHDYTDDNSFQAIALEWYGKQIWAEKHAENIKKRLELDIYPFIGRLPINQITRRQMLDALQKIEKRGALDVAKRINQYCTSIFDYAVIKGICETNPATGLSKILKTYKPKHRAYLKEDQLPEFIQKLEAYHGRETIKLAMKLLILTFVRPGELRGAQWKEINEKKAEWRIPPERMKMSREHIVPLSKQALAILTHLKTLTGHRELVFPGIVHPRKPISDVTLIKMLKILGYEKLATPHGMRATASTILNENGFKADVIERQLAHIEKNKVRAAYHHAEYLVERREMMQWWGNYIEEITKKPRSE